MSARWVFMILVCCRLSHASQPQGSRTCYDRLTTVCVSAGENVSVPCPMMKAEKEEVTYYLFRNGELVNNHTCYSGDCPPQNTSNVGLHKNTDNKSVSFVLNGVNASDHDVYRCESKVTFPPPYKTEATDLIIILVKGHHCNITSETPVPAVEQYCGLYWIVIVAIVTLYGIIVTVIAVIIWVKLRRTDSQSDYMNTKPKPARDRRKKRGVQNPFPRHF